MTREELRKKRKEIAESNGYQGYVPKSVKEGTRQEVRQTNQQPVQENKSTWQKITDRVNTIANSTPGRFVRKEIEIGKSITKPITSPTEYARDEIVTNIGKGINRIKQSNVSEAFKGWVDKGALSDGYQFGDVTRSAVATTQDIGKQVVKGGVAEPGEALGDLMSIAQAGYNEYIKGDKKRADAILKKASESHADDIASGIMGGIGTAFKYLAPGQKKRLLLEVGHALANKQNVGQSLKDSVMNTFKNKYGYYKDIEGQSFLGEAGENTVSSMSSNATQRFIQEQIGIPWQAQMALKTMPETYLEKRVNKGMSAGKSMLSSLTDFGIEWFTEEMFDGIKFAGTGHGTVNQFLNANINKIEDNVARTSLQYLKGVYGEGAEEVIGDYLSAISDYLIENYGEKELSLDDIKQIIIDVSKDPQTLKDFMSGSLSVLGQDVYTGGANIRGQYRNEQRKQGIIESNLTQKEKQTLIDSMENETSEKPSEKELKKQEETKTKVNEILNKLGDEDRAVVQYALEQNDIAKTISESDLSNEDKNMLFTFAENQKSSLEEVKNAIEDIKNDNYDFINQKQDTTTQNEAVLPQAQQTNQLPTKQAENEISDDIGLNLRKSIDAYNNSRQEGDKIFDINDENTKKEIDAIQKVAEKRGLNVTFDESRFNNNNINAFYEYDDNGNVAGIVLNPNTSTKKYVQNLVVHEMTHSFEGSKEYDKLSKAVLDYAKSKGEYKNAIQDLKNTYAGVYSGEKLNKVVEKEAVANILGEKLGSKEFIDDLVNGTYSQENRNFVQKIYDFVKEQINRFKGYKDQEAYWNNVKKLFDEAYNKSEISKGEAEYSTSKEKVNKSDLQVLSDNTSTGTVYTDGNYVYKSTEAVGKYNRNGNTRQTIEAEVYNSLKNNPNVLDAETVEIDGTDYIKTPKENILSKDDIKDESTRKSMGKYVITNKGVTELLNAINDLSNQDYRYGDDLQVAVSNNNLKLMDFSNATKGNPSNDPIGIIQDNYNRLTQFLEDFGRTGDARLIDNIMDMMNRLQTVNADTIDILTRGDNSEVFNEIAQKVINDNANVQNAYYVSNMRGIPQREGNNEIYSSDTRLFQENGVKVLYTAEPLSKSFIDNWEITPIYQTNVNSNTNQQYSAESTTDNQGRTLSKQQQEYFKDSKARDKNGNLIRVYHGTPSRRIYNIR